MLAAWLCVVVSKILLWIVTGGFCLGLCMVTVEFAWWLSFSGGMFGVSVLLIGLWVLDFWLWLIWFDGLA